MNNFFLVKVVYSINNYHLRSYKFLFDMADFEPLPTKIDVSASDMITIAPDRYTKIQYNTDYQFDTLTSRADLGVGYDIDAAAALCAEVTTRLHKFALEWEEMLVQAGRMDRSDVRVAIAMIRKFEQAACVEIKKAVDEAILDTYPAEERYKLRSQPIIHPKFGKVPVVDTINIAACKVLRGEIGDSAKTLGVQAQAVVTYIESRVHRLGAEHGTTKICKDANAAFLKVYSSVLQAQSMVALATRDQDTYEDILNLNSA